MEQPAPASIGPGPVPDEDSMTFGELMTYWFEKFQHIKDEHILCPKISNSDANDYSSWCKDSDQDPQETANAETVKRILEGRQRVEITFSTSLIMASDVTVFSAQIEIFASRLQNALDHCDKCILAWHTYRPIYYSNFLASCDDEKIAHVNDVLVKYDCGRIDERMQLAEQNIKSAMDQKQKVEKTQQNLLAIYEALCLPEYLEDQDRVQRFQTVFSALQCRKPLKLEAGTLLPAMTMFLFDPDPERRSFAKLAWKRIADNSVTQIRFDWAIRRQLTIAMKQVIEQQGASLIHFWTGFRAILRVASPDVVINLLNLEEITKTVYDLAWDHLDLGSETALLEVLSTLPNLIGKAPTSFWNAVAEHPRSYVSNKILFHPALVKVLNKGKDLPRSPDGLPMVMAWVIPFLLSIGKSERYHSGMALIHTLLGKVALNPSLESAGWHDCLRGATEALVATLGCLEEEPIKLEEVNCAVNEFTSHVRVLLEMAWSERQGCGAVMGAVAMAFRLDAKAARAEYARLRPEETDASPVTAVERQTAKLWGLVARHLLWYIGPHQSRSGGHSQPVGTRVKIGELFLPALQYYCQVEPLKAQLGSDLSDVQTRFNSQLEAATRPMAEVVDALAHHLTSEELISLLQPARVLEAVIVLAHHYDKDVAKSAMDMIKTITGQAARVDAMASLTKTRLRDTAEGLAGAMDFVLAPPRAWHPATLVLAIGRDFLTALCDPARGRVSIEAGYLTDSEIAAVSKWWASLWKGLEGVFANIRSWARYQKRAEIENFCCGGMALVDQLLSKVGALASAFDHDLETTTDTVMAVMAAPQAHLLGVARMLRLIDPYVVKTAVRAIVTVLGHSKAAPEECIAAGTRKYIIGACTWDLDKERYVTETSLTDTQRVELWHALSNDVTGRPVPADGGDVDSGPLPSVAGTRPATLPTTVSSLKKPSKPNSITPAAVAEKPRSRPTTKTCGTTAAKSSAFIDGRRKEREKLAEAAAKFKAQDKAQRSERNTGLTNLMSGTAPSATAKARPHPVAPVALQADGPVRKVRKSRTLAENRARLNPSLKDLHHAVLAWDSFAAEQEHLPFMPPQGPIPLAGMDATKYRDIFYPLLLSEAWHSFVAGKAETTAQPYFLAPMSRTAVDTFIEVTAKTITNNPQQLLQNISEGDIVLISKESDSQSDQVPCSFLGRVSGILKTRVKDTPGSSSVQITYRMSNQASDRVGELMRHKVPEFKITKITNLVTIEREYAALESLKHIDLCDEVLNARASPKLQYGQDTLNGVRKTWPLNNSQAAAVVGAMKNCGFTLIQGPPGTGKTSTIVALVGALMNKPDGTEASKSVRPGKMMVCAPSNAAVDELVLRMMGGVMTADGFRKIKVVRLGRSDALDVAVRSVTLDELAEARLQGDKSAEEDQKANDMLHSDAKRIKIEIAQKREQESELHLTCNDRQKIDQVSSEIASLRRQQVAIGAAIESRRENGSGDVRHREAQIAVLKEADVLFTTLSGAGRDMLCHLGVDFETVIIDEAAQCVELSALIPMRYGCLKCILVGDPKQLPPTVLSRPAAKVGYDQSLFVRIQRNCPGDVYLLDTQYRMHPEISTFPAAQFYDGRLTNGPRLADQRQAPWHSDDYLPPYRFWHVDGSQDDGGRDGRSEANSREAWVAATLYQRFCDAIARANHDRRTSGEAILAPSVGVITPYKAQLIQLKETFAKYCGKYPNNVGIKLEFNTTDAFQGRECDVIIFSCVRSKTTGGIGFLSDARRMNVALTRGRSSVWILGNSRALSQEGAWAALIKDARGRGAFKMAPQAGPRAQKRPLVEGGGTPNKRARA